MLWLWALDNAPEGELGAVSETELARVCQFNVRRAGDFVAALVEAGFLDRAGETLRIHDWADYGGKYQRKRDRNREFMRKKRSSVDAVWSPRGRDVDDIEKIREENITKENTKDRQKSAPGAAVEKAPPGLIDYRTFRRDERGITGGNEP